MDWVHENLFRFKIKMAFKPDILKSLCLRWYVKTRTNKIIFFSMQLDVKFANIYFIIKVKSINKVRISINSLTLFNEK